MHAASLVTAINSQTLVARGEASSMALALAADFAAATTTLPIVATLHLARAASVLAIRTAASLARYVSTMTCFERNRILRVRSVKLERRA